MNSKNDRFIENFQNIEITRGEQQYSDFSEALKSNNDNMLQMATNKYLPIGSVVKLMNSQYLYMIVGFNNINENGQLKDYIACIYPNGINVNDKLVVFNHEDIEKINHIGFFDTHGKKYQSDLNNGVEI